MNKSILFKTTLLVMAILGLLFSPVFLYAQHLFSINYNDLSQEDVTQLKAQIVRSEISTLSLTRNNENRNVYPVALSSARNTKIIILNEQTGNNVVITPSDEPLAEFQLAPFFIEELRRAVLGEDDRYLVIETTSDFSITNVSTVSVTRRDVHIPQYLYGNIDNVQEALPEDRQIIHIFKAKPKLILADPNNPDLQRYAAQWEEEMSYYVYMYQLPDGGLWIYDEHFNSNDDEPGTRIGSNLQFTLSGNLNTNQQTATLHALGIWSEVLAGVVPVDIQIQSVNLGGGGIIGSSYQMPDYWDSATQTWYCSAVGNQKAGYNVVPSQRDISLRMNSQFNFYYPITGSPGSNQMDWITIILHEVCHGLGFYGLVGSNGNYTYTTSSGGGASTSSPGIYDRQLYQGATGSTTLTGLTASQRGTLVKSNNLYAGAPGSNLLAATGGTRVKVYAPTSWNSGSSVSHWDNDVTFSTIMRPFADYGWKLHTISARDLGMMLDLGWTEPAGFIIEATAGQGGTISPSGAISVNPGGSQTFTFTPQGGNVVSDVLINNVSNPGAVAAGSYTFSNVTANHTIHVTFGCAVQNLPLTEGFNTTTFPPNCWLNVSTDGSPWKRATSGSNPSCSPQSGAGMLHYDCWSYQSGQKGLFITPKIATNNQNSTLTFWMYRDNVGNYGSNMDKINVYLSSTQSVSGLTPVLTVHRCRNLTPVQSTDGWYQYTVNLSTAAMSSAYVIFEGVSDYGNNIYVDEITIGLGSPPVCNPVTNLAVNYAPNCTSAQVTWSAPASIMRLLSVQPEESTSEETSIIPPANAIFSSQSAHEGSRIPTSLSSAASMRTPNDWVKWCGANANAIGTEDAADFIVAARFTTNDLIAANVQAGDVISKIRFVPRSTNFITSVTIQIYQGGTSATNPGTLRYQQPVTQNLVNEQYNEVLLTTPYIINTSQELWIGYRVVTTGGWPAGCDAGPRVAGKGDLMYFGGSWSNLWDLTYNPPIPQVSANWNIEAFVTGGSSSSKTYNIYRDGALIQANHPTTSYTDATFNSSTSHTWSVAVVCPDGISDQVSVTKNACNVFVPVTNITNVPATMTVGTPLTLTGTVLPSNASNQTIVWSIQNGGTTGATLNGNTLNATATGTVTILATIVNGVAVGNNYTQNFTVTVNKGTQTAPAAPTMASRTATSITLNTIAGCEYRMNSGAWQASTTFSGLTPNTSYLFEAYKIETATLLASPVSPTSSLTTNKATLTGTVAINGSTVFDETLTATPDLTSNPVITNLGTLTYQWKRGATNIGTNNPNYTLMQADIGNTITVTVTAANCDGNVASTATGTVTKATQTAPDEPTLASKTTTSITLFIITGCEYRMDAGAWQASPTFSELTPNTLYQFEARKAETATHLASPAGPVAAFSTEPLGIEDPVFDNVIVYSHLNSVYIKTVETHCNASLQSVEILDMTGRLVHQSAITNMETVITLQVANGIYTVRLISQDDKMATRKVSITK